MAWRYVLANKIIMCSGGMDPMHGGHVSYLLDAANHGHVIVALNSDEWLKSKKGYAFMPWDQRAAVVGAIRGVIDVVCVDDADGTVREALRRVRPDYFAKGGDRTIENTPEVDLCNLMGIGLIWNCGGAKTASSSEIVQRNRLCEWIKEDGDIQQA